MTTNLENLIFKKSLTQTELAKKLNVPISSITLWKKGYSIPKKHEKKLCSILGCSPEELVGNSPDSEKEKLSSVRRINIFVFMENNKLNISELAAKIGTTRQYLSSLFFCSSHLPDSVINKMIEAFSLPNNYFDSIPDLRQNLIQNRTVDPRILQMQQQVMDKLVFKDPEQRKCFAPIIYSWISLFFDGNQDLEEEIEKAELELESKKVLLKLINNKS